MSSNLKVNTILPSTGTTIGIGTVGGLINVVGNIDVNSTSGISTFNGLEISGIVTAKAGAAVTYYGDGSNLTGITDNVVTINNNANNRIITGSGSANTLEGEANLTFDGNTFSVTTGTGVQHPFNFRNDFTPNAYRSDLLSTGNLTSNNSLRIGSVASSGGVTLQGNRTNDSAAKVNLILNPDGGDVGIGTVSPQSSGLTVVKHSEARLQVWANGDGSNGKVAIRADGTNTQMGTWSNHDIHLVRNTSIQATVSSTGISLPAGKGIDFSATGQGINSSSMSSEVLDDYEEGSWTPIISTQAGVSNCTYSYRHAYYTKVGRQVTAHFYISWTGATNHSGYIYFNNLPYASANLSSNNAIGSVMLNTMSFPSGYTDVVLYMGSNTSGTNLYYSKSGSGWDAGQHSNAGQIIASITYFTNT